MDRKYIGMMGIIIVCTMYFSLDHLNIVAKDDPEPQDPVWLQNVHKVLPGWDPKEDTPIPEWAKPDWAASTPSQPTEVSLHGPYSDNVRWINVTKVFTPMIDHQGAVYIDEINGIDYTLDNITKCPDNEIVNFILEHKHQVGSAVYDKKPNNDVPIGNNTAEKAS